VPGDQRLLILTPVKDARPFLDGYVRNLERLTVPRRRLSLGLLESDSTDGTWDELGRRLPALRRRCRRVGAWKRDFGYRIGPGTHRGAPQVQALRRTVLARSRNHLLFHALDDEDWVLWLDVDVVEYPADIVDVLLRTGKPIVQPHCVLEWGGPTFDQNAWRDHGRLHLDALRAEGEVVPLDAVGGTMLLVRADIHRDGLVFPAFPFGRPDPLARPGRGELETEGLGLMARAMGHRCWGLPRVEIRHAPV
jgi:peptide chain release factor subunit 1